MYLPLILRSTWVHTALMGALIVLMARTPIKAMKVPAWRNSVDLLWDHWPRVVCGSRSAHQHAVCWDAVSRDRRSMRAYVAETADHRTTLKVKLVTQELDGLMMVPRAGISAVLVIDAYPEAGGGMPLYIFVLLRGLSGDTCKEENGVLTDDGACIVLGRKHHCSIAQTLDPTCCIHHLPLVVSTTDNNYSNQLLRCHDLGIFQTCRSRRPLSSATVRRNAHRKTTPGVCTGAPPVCNYAILVDGVFTAAPSQTLWRLDGFYRYLLRHSYAAKRIGVLTSHEPSVKPLDGTEVHPLMTRADILTRMADACRPSSCIDTFLLYLSLPTDSSGYMHVRDRNGDGLATRDEIMSFGDVLSSLQNCHVRRAVLILDYPSSSQQLAAVKRAATKKPHSFVARSLHVIARPPTSETSDIVTAWPSTEQDFIPNCISDIYQKLYKRVPQSELEASSHFPADDPIDIVGQTCVFRRPHLRRFTSKHPSCQH